MIDINDLRKITNDENIIGSNVEPCFKCTECNEIMYTADVVKKLEQIVEMANQALNDITIIDYNNKVA